MGMKSRFLRASGLQIIFQIFHSPSDCSHLSIVHGEATNHSLAARTTSLDLKLSISGLEVTPQRKQLSISPEAILLWLYATKGKDGVLLA
ncbi:hypothetical protein L6452_00802 [Arctium lappa]|uniref:Uncharacterized protein n=1 Tax=Arctium lappa TaxID=4217 RepID=A0ACB9FGC7_ARCLA|nr:hypothetical protein L6452_00802 [Arctium lappa]